MALMAHSPRELLRDLDLGMMVTVSSEGLRTGAEAGWVGEAVTGGRGRRSGTETGGCCSHSTHSAASLLWTSLLLVT